MFGMIRGIVMGSLTGASPSSGTALELPLAIRSLGVPQIATIVTLGMQGNGMKDLKGTKK